MEADQGEAGQIMVNGGILAPALLRVAAPAPRAQLALVRVVTLVTCDAVGFQLIRVEVSNVAGITGDLAMLPAQRKPRVPVVIETDGFPLVRRVARFAFSAISGAMRILDPVTSDAGRVNSLPVL